VGRVGIMSLNDAGLTEDERTLVDLVAALTLADDSKSFAGLRQLYSEDCLHVPKLVFNAMRQVQGVYHKLRVQRCTRFPKENLNGR